MIESLVAGAVAVASTREDLQVELFAEEDAAVGLAVEARQREFTTGRGCARLALRQIGIEPVAIPAGARGEPVWPPGVVGSITHCRGYRACAVARTDDVLGIGIDAEVHEPLPSGVLEQVAFGSERVRVVNCADDVHLDRLLFSAKEAVYKLWFPLTKRWLGFEDVELSVDAQARGFRARLLVPGLEVAGVPLDELSGRWCVEDGLVATAVVLTR